MKKIAVIGVKNGWSSERLAGALEKKTGFKCLVDMDHVSFDPDKGVVTYFDLDLSSLDGIIIKKICPTYSPVLLDRLEILHFLNMRGLPFFSRPLNVMRVLNRLSCTVALRLGGIPMPPTVVTEDAQAAHEAVKRFKRAVFKPLYTSKARGMVVIEDNPDAPEDINEFQNAGNRVMYIQKMLDIAGQDIGIAFLGGKYLASFARVGAKESWNTTTHFGGKYHPLKPDQAVIELAGKAQSLFGLDFTIVDVAITDEGPFVFEVSAFGGFRGLLAADNIEAADMYSDYVLEKLNHVRTER